MEAETVTCELEAAEALARLSRSSASYGGGAAATESGQPLQKEAANTSLNPQGKTTSYAHTTVSNLEKTNLFPQTTKTTAQSRSNPVGKPRPKLTEAEREAQRIRRILANRESARQTIRRRQAMYLELRRKAADMLVEKESLKKEKELALKEYTSLKERNDYLKAQIAKINKAKQGKTQESPNKSREEISNTVNTGTSTVSSSHKQPSLMPCNWPFPYSDVFQFQRALSHSNIMGSSQLHFPHGGMPCLHNGPEHNMGMATGPGIPVFIVPVPWLLPFQSHNTAPHSCACNDEAQSSHQCSVSSSLNNLHLEDKIKLLSNRSVQLQGSDYPETVTGFTSNPTLFGGKRSLFENVKSRRNFRVGETSDINVVSHSESVRHGLLPRRNQELVRCPKKYSENAAAATEVRRRRKELMKMKDIRFHRDNTRY